MANLNVPLPADLKAFVEEQVVTEKYQNAGEYLAALVRAARKEKAEERLIALVKEADESGPATPMTPEDWERIHQEVAEGLAKRKRKQKQKQKK